MFLAFWVAIQFISIPICVGSLVRLYRCDKFCKCQMMAKRGNKSEEETPLLSSKTNSPRYCDVPMFNLSL